LVIIRNWKNSPRNHRIASSGHRICKPFVSNETALLFIIPLSPIEMQGLPFCTTNEAHAETVVLLLTAAYY